MKIWKYSLEPHGETIISTYKGAHPLSVGLDPKGGLSVWMRIDVFAAELRVKFLTIFTGEDFPAENGAEFIGTVVSIQQRLVFHIFQERFHRDIEPTLETPDHGC